MTFQPIVMLNDRAEGLLVFGKGRKNYHAVSAQGRVIRIVSFDESEFRYLRPAERKGKPYPVKRCASFWLNHSTRTITKRAKGVLRGLVRRAPAGAEDSSATASRPAC